MEAAAGPTGVKLPPGLTGVGQPNMDELEDFLSNGAEPADVTTDAEPAEPDGPQRDESGRFAPKQTGVEPQETVEVPPTEHTDKLPPETFKALKEEREKRQTLERDIQALRDQLTAPATPPAPPPSIWEDEQAYGGHIVNTAVQQASLNSKLDMSEMLASQAHDDFDEMKEKFIGMMQQNPALQQQALGAKHPWAEAYKIAKNAAKMESLGAVDVADMEAKLRAEIMAEMQAAPAQPSNLPRSLADAQSSRLPGSAPPQMLSMADILGR